MLTKLTIGAAMAAACALAAPVAAADVQWGVSVNLAPPAPMLVPVPPSRPGYLWTPGYWNWSHGRYLWMNGSWVRDRPGYVYWQPRWVMQEGQWRLQRGQWARGDRDRDGIPNRWDGDRDGDGVPNRYDRHDGHPRPQ